MTKPAVHTADLIRAVFRADPIVSGDGNTLVGFASVADVWTEIRSWEGNFLERLAPGAFRKTITDRRDQIKCLFNHGMDPQIGDKPLGRPTVMDERSEAGAFGLWTETPFSDVSYAADIRTLVADGAINGMSFRFSVVREEWNEEPGASDHNPAGLPERTITEVKLYEFGPVTFPAYEATTAGVRSRETFALWRGTPPHQRKELLRQFGIEGAGETATPSITDADAPPAMGTRRSKATALAALVGTLADPA